MPAYNFRFAAEFFWTLFLFAIVTIATAFYGQTADVSAWGGHEWKAFVVGLVPTLGRAVAAFIVTAVTGSSIGEGFSK